MAVNSSVSLTVKHVTAWVMSHCRLDALAYLLQDTKSNLLCFFCFALALAAGSPDDDEEPRAGDAAPIPAGATGLDG